MGREADGIVKPLQAAREVRGIIGWKEEGKRRRRMGCTMVNHMIWHMI